MTAPTIRVLLTEDSAADAELEVRELKRAGLHFTHRLVDSEQSFAAALQDFAPDVILSDFSMPGFDGMAALALARERSPETPFIFVSGTIGEEYAIRALKNGATDYVLKSNLLRLPAAVERALAEARERREKRRTEVELEIARERLASITASLPDMLWSADFASDRITYLSPAAKELLGHCVDDLMTHHDLRVEAVHPEDRPALLAAWEELRKGTPLDIEYRALHPDGSVRWIHDRGRLIAGPSGQPERMDGLARDITETMAQRRRIARLSRIRILLGATSSAIVRMKDRKELFAEFCRIAVARGGFVLARLVELDREGKARIAATTETDPRLFQALVDAYNADPLGADSLLAQALRSGEAMISNSLAGDERVKNRAALTSEGDYSLALLPIVVEGSVAGTVALRAREPGSFDHEEVRLLTEMVSNIALALESLAKQAKLEYLALYDPLTGLPNRTLFADRLTQGLAATRREGDRLALLVFDLERFKAINDTLGRGAGDEVLKSVARRLRETAAGENRVARLGTDQFAFMLPAVRDATDMATILGDTALRFLEAPMVAGERELRVAAKAGIAVFPEDGADAQALFRNAEAALKRAKETGERYLFYAPQINARVAEQVDIEHRLRRAVEQGELFLHFQPKFDLATRGIVGVEALMRWKSPDGGLVSPAKFVPVLEQTGLIFEAGQQVLAAAKRTYRGWKERGLKAPRIAVNVSALQLRRRSFVADVHAALGSIDTDGEGIDLELTESLLMTDVDESIRKLRELRAMGLRMALDDFGTGYSSLAYLSKLPLDTLKIDRSFVHGMTEHADTTSIISTIISLAQGLRLKVVAEGVETEQQAQLLRLLRCDQVQGYLFSPPVPVEKIETLL